MKLIIKVVLLLLFIYVTTDENINIYLQKCTSYCNKKYCNVSTACRPINRTSKFSALDIYFHQGVILEAPIYVELIAYKKFVTVYRPFMLKLKEEICGALLLRNHPLFKLFESEVHAGNMLDACPISGHRYLNPGVTNVNLYRSIPLIPIGEWKMEFIVSQNINGSEETIVSWCDYYEVKPTGATEF